MNGRWRVVGVALLVALAGCGAISPGDSGQTEATAETTVEGGTGDAQAVDAFEVAESHRDALANQSFTVTATTTVQYANGTAPLRLFVRTQADPNAGAVYSQQVADGREPTHFGIPSPGDIEQWITENASRQRVTYENGTTEVADGIRLDVSFIEQATRWEALATLLSDGDARVVGGAGDTIVVTGGDTEQVYGEPSQRTVTVRLADGEHIDSYTLSYETTRNGTPIQVTRTVRFTNVGETAVKQPSWVSDAQNSSS